MPPATCVRAGPVSSMILPASGLDLDAAWSVMIGFVLLVVSHTHEKDGGDGESIGSGVAGLCEFDHIYPRWYMSLYTKSPIRLPGVDGWVKPGHDDGASVAMTSGAIRTGTHPLLRLHAGGLLPLRGR
jgi:hypothetical protein